VLGGVSLPNTIKPLMPFHPYLGSETVGDKLHGQKGNSPDHQLRSLSAG